MCHYCVNKTTSEQEMFHRLVSVGTRGLTQVRKNLLSAQRIYLELGLLETASLYEEVIARLEACNELLHRGYVE